MEFVFKKSWKGIKNVDDWIRKINSSKKNEEGHSRLELAKYCNQPNFNADFCDLLKPILGFNIELNTIEFEHHSKFDNNGKGRMQDLGVFGSSNNIPFFVGVEAKVNEPFGVPVKSAYKEAIKSNKKNSNSKKKERIENLRNNFFPYIDIEKDNIPYQLLYAAAGTICEVNASVHILTILVFNTINDKNYHSFKTFIDAIHAEKLREGYFKATIAEKTLYIIYKVI